MAFPGRRSPTTRRAVARPGPPPPRFGSARTSTLAFAVSLLCPTPRHLLTDPQGRPYFLWDCEITLAEFEELLRTGGRDERAYWVGKLMRQAKPDDVFTWVTLREISDLWPDLERYLGKTREFWRWILGQWGVALGG